MDAEFELLKDQLNTLTSKVDGLSRSINNIEKLLAKAEGQNLALRLFKAESSITDLIMKHAADSWIPESVSEQEKKISDLEKFQYKILGIGVAISAVISTLGVAFGHWVVAKLF